MRAIRWPPPVRSRKSMYSSTCSKCSYRRVISAALASGTSCGAICRRARAAREPQLVGEHLHRHREIERAVARIGRNRRQQIAAGELDVGQPDALRAEHDGGIAGTAGLHDLRGAVARLDQIEGQMPLPRAGADHQAAIGDRVGEVLVHARRFQHVVGTRGARGRVRVREELRAAPGAARAAPCSSSRARRRRCCRDGSGRRGRCGWTWLQLLFYAPPWSGPWSFKVTGRAL